MIKKNASKKGKVIATVQGFNICQVLISENKPSNEIAIFRGKKISKKFPANSIQDAIAECAMLAKK